MGLTPATNRQVPEHAILDTFNKQVYLGNAFLAGTDVVTLSNTSETPLLYISNPALSGTAPQNGQALFNGVRSLNCPDPAGTVIFRVYKNPTVVSGGTAVTPQNCRLASATTSIAAALKSPTVSTNGTRQITLVVGFSAQSIDSQLLIVDPGQTLLITAQAVGAGTTAIAECQWFEL